MLEKVIRHQEATTFQQQKAMEEQEQELWTETETEELQEEEGAVAQAMQHLLQASQLTHVADYSSDCGISNLDDYSD